MGNERLDEYLSNASEDLPTVPAVAAQVIEALDDPDASVDAVRALIERDPALSARVLRVSNSSMYGFPAEIQGLAHAISLVGGRAVRNLVMAVVMRETYSVFGPLEQMLWEHSTAAGPLAAALAAELTPGVDTDEAFTVGLLHDIGKTALANSHRDEYQEVANQAFGTADGFAAIEREAFGFDHAELGARVVEGRSLPASAATAIRHHHDGSGLDQLSAAEAKLTALVAIASASLTRLGCGQPAPVEDLDLTALHAWSFLGLAESAVATVLEIGEERIEAARAFAG